MPGACSALSLVLSHVQQLVIFVELDIELAVFALRVVHFEHARCFAFLLELATRAAQSRCGGSQCLRLVSRRLLVCKCRSCEERDRGGSDDQSVHNSVLHKRLSACGANITR